MTAKTPLLLLILDGWGIRDPAPDNAISTADTPHWDRLWASCPHALLETSGEAVGLPAGQMGNSEVGHMNIGAGRIIYQDLTRISKSVEDGSFFENPALREAMGKVAAAGGRLHLLGLLSDGGVHSHISHVEALVEMARRESLGEVFVHAFMDGRDTPPKSGAGYLQQLEASLDRIGLGTVASVTGRYYAMDRDNRWERVERAYRALTEGEGKPHTDSGEAIAAAYRDGETDEFVTPRVICDSGNPVGTIGDKDGVIFFNFRADRARELTRALTRTDFD